MSIIAKPLRAIIGSRASHDCLIQTVRKIPNYAHNCNIQLVRLRVSSIIPLANFAVAKRLRRDQEILMALIEAEIDIYEPFALEERKNVRLVFPPLVEMTNNAPYLIDGTHRVLATLNEGLDHIQVIGITSTHFPPLPCEPTSWTSIEVTSEQKPLDSILTPFNPRFYRHVTSFFNSPQFSFNSISELVNYCKLWR